MGTTVKEGLLTSAEAEKYIRVAPGTLRTWRYQGKGPDYLKSGNFVKYLQSDLDFWLDSCRQGVKC